MTNFELVSAMNEAFGNRKGNPTDIQWGRVRKQCQNIGYEFCELLNALGADPLQVAALQGILDAGFQYNREPVLKDVRDALEDGHVFGYGAHHMMGIDADRDMQSVINGVMSRFVKDPDDLDRTLEMHAAKGVGRTYTEGNYPTMVLKSAIDQPDAPQGKFLKSASYKEPVFYDVNPPALVARPKSDSGAFDPLPGFNDLG